MINGILELDQYAPRLSKTSFYLFESLEAKVVHIYSA